MTRIAHLSDLHLLEDEHPRRGGVARVRLGYVSLLRPLDAAARRRRAAAALAMARGARADHVVVTGDLTEDGVDAQFEVLAEVLSASGIAPERITLVPGNHDLYHDGDAWSRALDGPLAAYAGTSRPGAVTELRDAAVVAVSTAMHQPFTTSAGVIDAWLLLRIASLAADPALATRALVFAQHHPPLPTRVPLMQWIDGLRDHEPLRWVLECTPHAHVVHGHTHRARDRRLREGEEARVFSTEAVVSSLAPLRVYEARGCALAPVVDDLPVTVGTPALA